MCHLIDVLADFVKLLRVEDFPLWLNQGETEGHIIILDKTSDKDFIWFWNRIYK